MALDDAPPSAATMLALLGTLVSLLLIAVGVLSTAGEWTHGTVQTTFLAVPRRGRVLAAKYAGTALLGAAHLRRRRRARRSRSPRSGPTSPGPAPVPRRWPRSARAPR